MLVERISNFGSAIFVMPASGLVFVTQQHREDSMLLVVPSGYRPEASGVDLVILTTSNALMTRLFDPLSEFLFAQLNGPDSARARVLNVVQAGDSAHFDFEWA